MVSDIKNSDFTGSQMGLRKPYYLFFFFKAKIQKVGLQDNCSNRVKSNESKLNFAFLSGA